jgi:uncharacterized glyoxalase superfamily protein PhnB
VLHASGSGKKLLFNKDRGFTLPRLKLKADLVVQPEIEILKMASFFGSIRCAVTMLPPLYVKDGCPLKINISKGFSPETKNVIKDLLNKNGRHARVLSRQLWVSKVFVCVDQKGNSWEFDEFSRTMYMTVSPDQASDPGECCHVVNDLLRDLGGKQSQCLGTNLDVGK